MATDFTGINNHNEYFTNHYFSSYLADDITKIISKITQQELKQSPWSKLREVGNYYAVKHDKLQSSVNYQMEIIPDLAQQFLDAMGYEEPVSESQEVEGKFIPVYSLYKDSSSNPRVMVLLSLTNSEEGVLDGNIFDVDRFGRLSDVKDECSSVLDDLFFKLSDSPRWIMVFGVEEFVLIDREKWGERRYISFDLEDVFGRRDESTYKAITALTHSSSLIGMSGQCEMDVLIDTSRRNATGVSQDLKYALRESIEILGNEVIYDQIHRCERDVDEQPIDAGKLTLECLRYMYRMLFVLFIESRPELGYAPMNNLPYMQGYSLEGLRDVAENIRDDIDNVSDGYYLHETLSKLYDIIYTGYPVDKEEMRKLQEKDSISDVFVLEPLKAHIFDPEYTPTISASKLRNSAMLRIIDLMSVTRGSIKKGSRRGRISYSALGINQMGAVYEALLSYRGFIAEDKLYEVKPADEKDVDELKVGYFVKESELEQYDESERARNKDGSLRTYEKGTFIYRLAGREREKSASYYTPESLTKTLVKYSLKELLEGKTADEILQITICEPAMGSAAFLNESVNQLAEAYLAKKQVEVGKNIDYDHYRDELQRVKMYIADKNVYGVDLNPIAVELAEVSLWLNTIFKGGYIPWFKTQLVNGNSLIGARRQCYNVDELQSDREPLIWYSHKPTRILPKSARNINRQIYHFLSGDPGMSNYTDKVIKQLYPEEIKKINAWRKAFTKPYILPEIQTMKMLSELIDRLWMKQIGLRHEISKLTSDKLSVWMNEDDLHNSHTTIREKDEIFSKVYLTEDMQNAGPYARLKFAMDYWCALWFWPVDKADLLPNRSQFLSDMHMILSGGKEQFISTINAVPVKKSNLLQVKLVSSEVQQAVFKLNEEYEGLGEVDLNRLCTDHERLSIVRQLSQQYKFFHWELEFADIFESRGGFDLIIGNPPWIKLEWMEEGILSEYYPKLAVKKESASNIDHQRPLLLQDDYIKKAYFDEYISISGMQNYYNSVSNYEELAGVQTNLFKCFIPQSILASKIDGVFSFVHPNGIFDDPKGSKLRELIYPKLKNHFRFANERFLFADIHHSVAFSLNVYRNVNKKDIDFEMICNLYEPITIEESYSNKETKLMGIKDDEGNWNIVGHSDRIIKVTDSDLSSFARLFGNDNYLGTHLVALHSKQLLQAVEKMSSITTHFSDYDVYMSEMLHETNSQKNGLIVRNTQFPDSVYGTIYSGPNISLSNPLSKTPRKNCSSNTDYDSIPLDDIPSNYLPRCNYMVAIPYEQFTKQAPESQAGRKYLSAYRMVSRKMLNISQERTLNCSIIPPGVSHTNGLVGFMFNNDRDALTVLGTWSSLPFDYLIKIMAKTNMNMDNAAPLPAFSDSPILQEIQYRALKLNALTEYYGNLVKMFEFSIRPEWSRKDSRLSPLFETISGTWSPQYPLRGDFERRMALLEIDVLTSILLGLTLDELCTIYRLQFPVFKTNEENTWYDSQGKIVFTTRALVGDGVDRATWEKNQNSQRIVKNTVYDHLPSGPKNVSIEYISPFTRCDREEDYRIAWEFFTSKYGVKQ